jgi:hypothetical protein
MRPTRPHAYDATAWLDRLARRVALNDHDAQPQPMNSAEAAEVDPAPSPGHLEPNFSRRHALTLAFATALGATQLRWLLTPSYARSADCYSDYTNCVDDVNSHVIGKSGVCAFPTGLGLILTANPLALLATASTSLVCEIYELSNGIGASHKCYTQFQKCTPPPGGSGGGTGGTGGGSSGGGSGGGGSAPCPPGSIKCGGGCCDTSSGFCCGFLCCQTGWVCCCPADGVCIPPTDNCAPFKC